MAPSGARDATSNPQLLTIARLVGPSFSPWEKCGTFSCPLPSESGTSLPHPAASRQEFSVIHNGRMATSCPDPCTVGTWAYQYVTRAPAEVSLKECLSALLLDLFGSSYTCRSPPRKATSDGRDQLGGDAAAGGSSRKLVARRGGSDPGLGEIEVQLLWNERIAVFFLRAFLRATSGRATYLSPGLECWIAISLSDSIAKSIRLDRGSHPSRHSSAPRERRLGRHAESA